MPQTPSAAAHTNRSLRPCLSSPAISCSVTAPPPSPAVPTQTTRKSRRYCTDFEFGDQSYAQQLRDELRELQPGIKSRSQSICAPQYDVFYSNDDARSNHSSAELTPLATYADSDGSSSSFDHEHDEMALEFAFPRPPENPHISGRGEDFPLCTELETDAFKSFLRKWEATVAARRIRGKKSVGERRDADNESDFSWEAKSSVPHGDEFVGAGAGLVDSDPNVRMSMPREDDVSLVLRGLRGEQTEEKHRDETAREHAPIPSVPPLPFPSDIFNQGERSFGRTDRFPGDREVNGPTKLGESHIPKVGKKSQRYRKFTPSLPSSDAMPQIIREVASVAAKKTGDKHESTNRHIPDAPIGFIPRLAPRPSLPALSRLGDSMSKFQRYRRQTSSHHIDPTVRAGLERDGSRGSPFDSSYVESSGGRHQGHRAQISMPHGDHSGKLLATPFSHRPTQSHPGNLVRSGRAREMNTGEQMKSFMDITPEQDAKRSSQADKVRKLLARASSGVIGWGKSLGRKKMVGGR